jgi:hypothetical protein
LINGGSNGIAGNVKALAMWPEFMASSARLPMPDKGRMFQVKIYCSIDFRLLEPLPNSIPSAQCAVFQASHIANAMLPAGVFCHV